jgi:hypothetical protein
MDINTLLSERMTFNNFLFSMSFPDIVNYLEKNPSAMSKVEWDLFTNSKIRTSKNIDSYPELILKHSNWPWRFNISQIQNELSRKISELSRLSKPSVKPMSSVKIEKDNWIDKVINSMEKLCEIQNKIKIQDSQIIINEIKKEEQEIKREREKFTGNIAGQQSLSRIISEEMPPEDPISFSDDDELEDEELEEDLEEELEDEELEDEELEDEELEYEFFSPF